MNTFLLNLLSIASLALKIRIYILDKYFYFIDLNLVEHKNKPEHLPINNQKKVRFFFWQIEDICLYLYLFFVVDNNLIVSTKHKK